MKFIESVVDCNLQYRIFDSLVFLSGFCLYIYIYILHFLYYTVTFYTLYIFTNSK
jgi:hypothetical protein